MSLILIQGLDILGSEQANLKSDCQEVPDLEETISPHTLHLTTMECEPKKERI